MSNTITLIYPFRNRDAERVKNSLTSLEMQSDKEFKVIFIDFGSDLDTATSVKKVVQKFDFAQYFYTYHIDQPWNKCKAINIALDKIDTSHCFVSDVDMIYHPSFVEIAKEQINECDVVYFQVGYLPLDIVINLEDYESIKEYRISNDGATGLTLFNTEQLKSINGFDEYYHFWSSEDTDAHIRMKNAGYSLKYYDEKLLIKHQPHPTFRSRESKNITKELRLTNAVRLNQRRMLVNKERNITAVNQQRAQIIDEMSYLGLDDVDVIFEMENVKSQVDYYILEELKRQNGKKVKMIIKESSYYRSVKYRIKEMLGKITQPYMSLKEVNDLLLQQIVFNYRDRNYAVRISDDLKSITVLIDLR